MTNRSGQRRNTLPGEGRGDRRGWWALLPSAALAGLATFSCPLCVAAYSGVLASLAGGALATRAGLASLAGVFLALSAGGIAWSVRGHLRYGPLWLALAGSAGVIAERLIWNVPALLYGGVGTIIASSIWNLWVARGRPLIGQPAGRYTLTRRSAP